MDTEIHLDDLREALGQLSYPIDRTAASDAMADVTVLYADGQEPLDDLIDRVPSERFESVDGLLEETLGSAPLEAVGEPGQSEGDA